MLFQEADFNRILKETLDRESQRRHLLGVLEALLRLARGFFLGDEFAMVFGAVVMCGVVDCCGGCTYS